MKDEIKAERKTNSHVETIIFTAKEAADWPLPPFQRAVIVNQKVMQLAADLKSNGGILPGIISFGQIIGQKEKYLIDGQQRREAFLLSELPEGYVDTRLYKGETMGDLAEEFVRLNSHLVNFKTDDILRGMELRYEPIALLRKKCPFIGYDMVRRGDKSPLLSMSTTLRAWLGSLNEVPGTVRSAAVLATELTAEDAQQLSVCLQMMLRAWGKDVEYARLWLSLNISLTFWLYRRIVLSQYSTKSIRIDNAMFEKCLMSMSANKNYVDWLLGRHQGKHDRSPCFHKLKEIFTDRLRAEGFTKINLPAPDWAHGGGHKHRNRNS